MESKDLIKFSISKLKKLLKTANEEDTKRIKAELNCRGIYLKK